MLPAGYLMVFLLTLAYLAATASSNAQSGVPAILVTLPWSQLLAGSLTPWLLAQCPPMTAGVLTLTAAALPNTLILAGAGWLMERRKKSH